MDKKKLILIAILALFVSSTLIYAKECPLSKAKASTSKEQAADKEVVNSVCPVLGGEVSKDTPNKIEYEGKTIGFCCAGCVDKFKADPENYLDKLDEEAKTE